MSDLAVLVVDMLNSYQHPDAEILTPNTEKIIEPLSELIQRASDTSDIDVIYVNDNYGDFTAEFSDVVRSARHIPVVVPTDAGAGIDAELSDAALTMMKRNMDAELTTAAECLG